MMMDFIWVESYRKEFRIGEAAGRACQSRNSGGGTDCAVSPKLVLCFMRAIGHWFAVDSTMTVSVFVGTSVDGFIARANGDFDFLPEGGGEPHGYTEFMASVDALVIGRNTFEKVRAFPTWPYGDKLVVVLSSRPVDFSAVRGGVVEQMAGPPAEIVSKLAETGARHLYVDGGITIQRFLRADQVHRLTITRVPVLIGDGIPLFGSLLRDVKLRHVATQQYPSGLVKSEYEIAS
jgi:dihydrofolate reductase